MPKPKIFLLDKVRCAECAAVRLDEARERGER